MLSEISIVCFAASYSVSLGLESTRLLFRTRIRYPLVVGFGIAGWIAHSLFLAFRIRQQLDGGLPLSSWLDWCLLAAWVLVAIYLLSALLNPRVATGLFLLPAVLILIGLARLLRDLPTFSQDESTRLWGMLHGLALLVGTVVVVAGFVAGVMYLVQAHRLKHKLPPRAGLELPSLEWLQRANERALVFSSFLLVLGVGSGIILNLVKHARLNTGTPWTDPVVWGSGILLLWLTAALLFKGLYKPARQGRKVAYLTVACFLFLMLAIGLALMAQHASVADQRLSTDLGRRQSVDWSLAGNKKKTSLGARALRWQPWCLSSTGGAR